MGLLIFVFVSLLRATTPNRPDSPEALQGNVSVKLQLLQHLKSAVRVPPVLHGTSPVYVTQRYQTVTSAAFHDVSVSLKGLICPSDGEEGKEDHEKLPERHEPPR